MTMKPTGAAANGISQRSFPMASASSTCLQTAHQQGDSPNAYHVQVPSGMLSPREQSDCEMGMQESPTWPPRINSPGSYSNRLNRVPSLTETFTGLTSPPAAASISPMQFPFGGYCAPAARGPQHAVAVAAPHPAAGGAAGSSALPSKVLKAVEKPPNSPSDLPGVGGNLRKVALLRALLVRTEQHLQHQQEQVPEQQHDMQHHQQQQYQHTHSTGLEQGHHQQQHCTQAVGQNSSSSTMAGTATQVPGYPSTAGEQHTCSHNSDDMDCSSMSDSPSSTPHPTAAAGPGGLEDPATSSLLCNEVLVQSSRLTCEPHQQQQMQPEQPNWYMQGNTAATQHHGQPPGQQAAHQYQQSQTQLQQQQQLHMLPPRAKLKSPELSTDQLEALRAKALASTSTLNHLEPEDLHSLQISITAGQCRRGSDHSHMHSTLAPTAASRRHSSHI